jgi:hypothetical protein
MELMAGELDLSWPMGYLFCGKVDVVVVVVVPTTFLPCRGTTTLLDWKGKQ